MRKERGKGEGGRGRERDSSTVVRRTALPSIIDDPGSHVRRETRPKTGFPIGSENHHGHAPIGSGYPHDSSPAFLRPRRPPLPLLLSPLFSLSLSLTSRLSLSRPPFAAGSGDFREARADVGRTGFALTYAIF